MTTTKPIHGQPVPKDMPPDLVPTSPIPCAFSVGDPVIYTNDNGLSVPKIVKGFVRKPEGYSEKHFIYLNLDCWWVPIAPECLKHAKS